MPKYIKITDAIKKDMTKEFTNMLNGLSSTYGEFVYKREFAHEKENAILWFTPMAYNKSVALIKGFASEVAWHGTVSRIEGTDNEFLIEDILVFPQDASSHTVGTDQQIYQTWLYRHDDDTFNKIRMQGHSHVNMGVQPSGVDIKHRQSIISQLEPDMFYIFMIWNKAMEFSALIYDMAHNVIYEDDEIEIMLHSEVINTFMEEAFTLVQMAGHVPQEWHLEDDEN